VSSEIQRALQLFYGFARYTVSVDHRRSDIGMAEQRLDRADVVVGLQEMGGEAVAEGMRRRFMNLFLPRPLNQAILRMSTACWPLAQM